MRQVIPREQIFDVLVDVHYDVTKHVGYRNTFDKVGSLYSHISRKIVEEFVRICPTCNTNKSQITRAPLQPIISSGFWQRMQIDLVDMKSVPDDDAFTKIGHCVDHFSKFHVVFALKTKTAEEVVNNLSYKIWFHTRKASSYDVSPYLGWPKLGL